MLLILVFMVIEALTFPEKIHRQVNAGNPRFERIFGYTKNIREYLGITSLLGIIGGAIASVSLAFIGVEFAVLWGVLYFVMNFVPMVGFWIAMLPPLLIALTTLGFMPALAVFLIYAVMSFLINQAIKPAMMRGGLDLSPLWSILSMVVWSTILGAPGLIIGIPLTIAIKVLVLESDPESRWIAEMISADATTHAPALDDIEKVSDQTS
jgi:predicted PurR-regulated permease PerM